MSLKALHIFLMVMSILLAFGFGAWVFQSPLIKQAPALARTMGIVSFLGGVSLAVYLGWFVRKIRKERL